MNHIHPIKWLLVAILIITSITVQYGQVPFSQAEIQAQLQSKGVTQDQVDDFLESRNMSLKDLENLSPDEFVRLNEEFDIFVAGIKGASDTESSSEAPEVKIEKIEITNEAPAKKVEVSSENDPEAKNYGRYGDHLFKSGAFNSKSEIGIVAGTYVLDVGDQVAISIFGNSQLSGVYTIDESGAIVYASKRKRVLIAGLTLNEARTKLEKVFRRSYSFNPGEFSANVIGARTISVNVYGEVQKSGGYILSAVNSPINAIAEAGGISKNGSYRNIRILKSDGSVKAIDLYEYLQNPEVLKGIGLSNNDVIHVPIASKSVRLNGAVKKPLIYEVQNNETLKDIVEFAGGLLIEANTQSLQVSRYEGTQIKVIDVDFTSTAGQQFVLKNGDEIYIKRNSSLLENVVSVKGQVNNKGQFELKQNMKLNDLVSRLVFNNNSRTDLALLKRTEKDGQTKLIKVNLDEILSNPSSTSNISLQTGDELLVWSLKRFTDSGSNVIIGGAVKYPGKYPYDDASTYINDLMLYAGGLRRDASNVGIIYRKDPLNPNKIQYLRFNPLLMDQGDNNKLIMPFDSILILQDVSISDNYTVEIAGEIKRPGEYQFGEGMSVKDLIVLADGFNLAALTERVEINRIIIQNNKATEIKVALVDVDPDLSSSKAGSDYVLQPFDKVFVRSVPEFELQNVVILRGSVKYPGKYVLENKNEKLSSIIDRAGGLTKEAFLEGAELDRSYKGTGHIIMNLEEVQKSSRSKYNYILKNNDIITIPKKEDIVTLQSNTLYKRITTLADNSGTIDNNISIAYFPGKRANYYIQEFGGGFGETSDRKNVFVEHANGEVARTKNFLLYRSYPKVRRGSTIVIPEEIQKLGEKEEDKKVDWTSLLNDAVAQAMSILTLLLLVERL